MPSDDELQTVHLVQIMDGRPGTNLDSVYGDDHAADERATVLARLGVPTHVGEWCVRPDHDPVRDGELSLQDAEELAGFHAGAFDAE